MPSYIQDYFEQSATVRMLDPEGRAEIIRRAPQSLSAAICEAFRILDEQRKSRLATI